MSIIKASSPFSSLFTFHSESGRLSLPNGKIYQISHLSVKGTTILGKSSMTNIHNLTDEQQQAVLNLLNGMMMEVEKKSELEKATQPKVILSIKKAEDNEMLAKVVGKVKTEAVFDSNLSYDSVEKPHHDLLEAFTVQNDSYEPIESEIEVEEEEISPQMILIQQYNAAHKELRDLLIKALESKNPDPGLALDICERYRYQLLLKDRIVDHSKLRKYKILRRMKTLADKFPLTAAEQALLEKPLPVRRSWWSGPQKEPDNAFTVKSGFKKMMLRQLLTPSEQGMRELRSLFARLTSKSQYPAWMRLQHHDPSFHRLWAQVSMRWGW